MAPSQRVVQGGNQLLGHPLKADRVEVARLEAPRDARRSGNDPRIRCGCQRPGCRRARVAVLSLNQVGKLFRPIEADPFVIERAADSAVGRNAASPQVLAEHQGAGGSQHPPIR
jgi:hypothetical protein